MNDNEVKTVQMTAEEAAQYAAFKAEQERKAAADKARKDRKVYGQMVDEEIRTRPPDAAGAERRHPHGQGAGA